MSPDTVVDPRLTALLGTSAIDRVVLEVSEHAAIADVGQVLDVLAPLRAAGLRTALDDVGVGYSGLERLLHLHPDFIKVDYVVTHEIDVDSTRTAMVSAMRIIAHSIGATLVAEGVENEGELATLVGLGVPAVQGFLFGAPATVDAYRTSSSVGSPPRTARP